MRTLKMFGLAVVAAVAAMAFVGASSAMAESTLLCNSDQALGSCTSATTHVHSVATKPTLVTSIGTVECESALLLGEVLGLGSPQITHGNLTYTTCKLGKTACKVVEKSAGVLVETLKEGTELAKVTGAGEVEVECGALIKCVYGGSPNFIGHGLGPLVTGDTGHTTYTNAEGLRISGFCPETSKLTALFVNLTSVYINS